MIDKHIWKQLIGFVEHTDRHEYKLNKLYLAYDRQKLMNTTSLALSDRQTDRHEWN